MTDKDPSGHQGAKRPAPPTSFFTIIARSWRWYQSNMGPLIRLYAALGGLILAAQVPLFLSDGPPFALSFSLGVLFPAAVYGYAYGVTAHMLQQDADDDPLLALTAVREVRTHIRPIVNAAIIGSALSALNPLAPFLPAFFYGPPILMQVIAVERREIPDAWARVKDIMDGTWGRVILYLISLSLALGALIQTVFGFIVVASNDLSDAGQTTVLHISLAVFMTVTLPYLASAQFTLYDDVRAKNPPPQEDPSPD